MASLSVFFRLRESGTLSFASFHLLLNIFYSNDVEESIHVCALFFSPSLNQCAHLKRNPHLVILFPNLLAKCQKEYFKITP